MSEAVARDRHTKTKNEPSCCGKKAAKEEEISEAFAREREKVNDPFDLDPNGNNHTPWSKRLLSQTNLQERNLLK